MISNDEYCAELKMRIEAEYERSGNRLGWRLLASPRNVLDGAEIALVGINPAGRKRPVDHPQLSTCPGKSAYVHEKWAGSSECGASRLQKQVRTLFGNLEVEPHRVLAGNLVPFRSRSWDCLENRATSLRFGKELWHSILKRAKPRLVIGMGRVVWSSLSEILDVNEEDWDSVQVNWGKVSAKRAKFRDGDGLLVLLPYLGRFGIVTRDDSADALKEIFGEYWHA